ncbi:MAG: CopG family transcriptional regulator [Desulfovibrionales bacterium]|nr:MAG: CopG family transcriptional regulator [Desulfovibrionales bacterium]
MTKPMLAMTNEEFDQRFDNGEDTHTLVDLSQAIITKPGKKCRITIDVSQTLVDSIDRIRHQIGVDRGALIKVWLHERVQKELTRTNSQ